MPSLDSAFGIHEPALEVRSKRAELLASNLANADTPNYRARDIDFKAVLSGYQAQGHAEFMRTTNARHLGSGEEGVDGALLYRNPSQASIDGNSVDPQVEKAAYLDNSIHYQTTLTIIDGRIKTLRKALRGD